MNEGGGSMRNDSSNWENNVNDINDCDDCNNRRRNRCNSCICQILRRLPRNTEVDVFLSGGNILEDVVFKRLNRNNCCAFFNDPTTEPGSTLIVDCNRIDAIRLEADDD
ncbi:hydrolase [Rummeliibacillus sp. JY-2-4R]